MAEYEAVTTRGSGWRAFWNRGGWWKALIVVVVYAVVYQFLPLLFAPLFADVKGQGLLDSPGSVLAGFGFAVILGSAVLLAFSWTLGWLPRPLFTRQPVSRSWWMWIAPALALLPILLRLIGIDWGRYGAAVVAVTMISGLFVGLAEELLFRGLVVSLLRKAGHREWSVAAVSSLFFALMHSTNIFMGQAITTVGFTVLYTFCFGVLMYLTMRVTGNLIWAVILHGLTDPTGFLAVGGIDENTAGTTNPALGLVAPTTYLLLLGALVLLIFIRGQAYPTNTAEVAPAG